jgi:predicted dehydrogenase
MSEAATSAASLKLAFAGANPERGWARDAHIPAIRSLPGLSIHAVSARTKEGADAAAAAFGAALAFADSVAMARDPGADIVAVTVKVPEHRAIVLAALEAGKHVYCEWPLGRDVAEAEEMAAAAHRAGTHVAIGLQGANSIAVRHAARLVCEGVIGELQTLRVVSPTAGWGAVAPPHYAYLQDRRNGATLATIAGGHTLAMVEAVVGECTQVSAQCTIRQGSIEILGTGERVERTCPDHMEIEARHASGCKSTIEVVGGEDGQLVFELQGSKGSLEIRGAHPGGYQCAALEVVTSLPSEPQPPVRVTGLSGNPVNVAELHRRFEEDIRTGRRTVPDFDAAVRLTRLLDAIELASDSGREQVLEPNGTWSPAT